MCGVHFSHYKTAACNDLLKSLHMTKLNIGLTSGKSLDIWCHSLMTFLQKEYGNIEFDKLRAVVLFEADFNWIQKIIFSGRMANMAVTSRLIAQYQYAAPGKDGNKGTLLELFHNNIHDTMHIPLAIVSADLDQCYDAVHHSVSALGVQSFGVPQLVVNMMLACIQSMALWIRTGYSVSETPLQGTSGNPFLSLLQGPGMWPWVFLSVSTLMVEGYKSLGHGRK